MTLHIYRSNLLIVTVVVAFTSACEAKISSVANDLLVDDLVKATKAAEQLSSNIEPDISWHTWSREKIGCFGLTGQITGYQTKHTRELTAEAVGRALEVEAIFETARQWFPKQDFDIIRDVAYEDGFHEILAVNETEGMGMSIDGYEKIIGIKATTKCR